MSVGAVVMMSTAILIVWGGLALAVIRLRHHPDPGPEPDEAAIPPAE